MEFEEHEHREEEMAYDSVTNSAPRPIVGPTGGEGAPTPPPPPPPPTLATTPTPNSRKSGGGIRYRECLKNHAVTIGGHAVDGCGEFMAAGEEGTLDALKCAACNCHRNFHRKETDEKVIGTGEPIFHHHHPQFSPFYRAPQPSGYLHITPPPPLHHRPLALPAASGGGGYSRDDEDMSNPSSSGGGGGIGGVGSGDGGASGGSSRKRFRTKFTVEQKDKMLEFAEKVGWRIQKHDEVAVEQFCAETGVRRHVLKVWMHNNKHTLGKKP